MKKNIFFKKVLRDLYLIALNSYPEEYWVAVKSIRTNTWGTSQPRVFVKRIQNKSWEEYENWIKKLPDSGTKYQSRGFYLWDVIREAADDVIYSKSGAGISSAEIYEVNGYRIGIIDAVEGESFDIDEENKQFLFNAWTIRNPEREILPFREDSIVTYYVIHENPGRYDIYYMFETFAYPKNDFIL